MSELVFYNSATKTKAPFRPINPDHVRLYVCGPTVYDHAHIGNGRAAIVFDLLFRLLRHVYGDTHVIYVRNVTDVDDKINARAARDFPDIPLNMAIAEVTTKTLAQYHEYLSALGCLSPTQEPRATEHIADMGALITRLVERGVAYVAQDHVLFSPSSMGEMPRYGALARRELEDMLAGARIEIAPYKRDPMDFVLWKPSKNDEPAWPSPCGIAVAGRPGWHIECSAMAMRCLLVPFGGGLACEDPERNMFDIHGGGIDLIFPHHENEIAQSCCAFGTERVANVWMHNGFLQVEGEKMSKSLGNFVTMHDLLRQKTFGGRRWSGPTLRLAMLRSHYRQPIDWTVRALEEAESSLQKFATRLQTSEAESNAPRFDDVVSALADDLNTPQALSLLYAMRDPRDLEKALTLMGIDIAAHKAWQVESRSQNVDEDAINALISDRNEARARKDWAESDRIRDLLLAQGVILQDNKDGTRWEVKP